MNNTNMAKLEIVHYYFPSTDPWKNIMLLPEEEAFRVAQELADAHPDTTSFGRFADFENYYPARKAADEYVREAFIQLGGQPELNHPYAFTLGECEYLRTWFSSRDKLVYEISEIPDEQISFTLGDSCALLMRGDQPVVLTKQMLLKSIHEYGNDVDMFLKNSLVNCAYVEAQVWKRLG